jgi:hypothetical protein
MEYLIVPFKYAACMCAICDGKRCELGLHWPVKYGILFGNQMNFHIYLVNITPKFKKFQFICINQLNVYAMYIFCMINYLQNSIILFYNTECLSQIIIPSMFCTQQSLH